MCKSPSNTIAHCSIVLILSVLYFNQLASVKAAFLVVYLLLMQTLCITSAALKSVCGGFLLLILQYDTPTKSTKEGKGFLAGSSRAHSIMAGCRSSRRLKQLVTWHPQPGSREMNEWMPALSPFSPCMQSTIPFPGNGPLTIKIGLHKSVNALKIIPYRNGQRLASQVILDSVKLAVNTDCHGAFSGLW